MLKSRLITMFAAVMLFIVPAAQADLYTFDLTGSNSTQSSFSVLDATNFYTAVVTGFNTSGSASVNRSSSGMGVYSGGQDDTQVDGNGPDETLRFTLPHAFFQLVQVVFQLVGSDDDFTLTVDGSYQGYADVPNSGIFNFGGTYIGQVFDLGVAGSNDDYKISSITFSAQGQGGEEVPEPATMLLLGSGALGALAARRRREA